MTDATHTLDAGKAEAAAGTAALTGGTATGEVTLGLAHFKEANEQVRKALASADAVVVRDANAQRANRSTSSALPATIWAATWMAAPSWCTATARTRWATP